MGILGPMNEYEMLHIVTAGQAGERLDRVLGDMLPDSGLRMRRRLIEEGRVLVQGKTARTSMKVKAGQEIVVLFANAEQRVGLPGILLVQDGLAAVDKPHGMHSAALAGSDSLSLETLLPQLFPGEKARLLNRLDGPTSGIVLVALTDAAAENYSVAEKAGQVHKEYLAIVDGNLSEAVVVKNALDTDNRKKTRVLADIDSDARRWTEVEPVQYRAGHDMTLVRCRIRLGARHQIRAHLASLGHPILGDELYGGSEAERLYLHHHYFSCGRFQTVSVCNFS